MSEIFASDLLAGKTAVITGGGSGLGRDMAERFASLGAKVVVMGRTQSKLDDTARAIADAGGRARGVSCDVRDAEAVKAAMKNVHDTEGEIDILVCGAAGNFPSAAANLSAKGFATVVDIDLNGTFNSCREAYPFLRKPGASIMAISANLSSMPTAFQAHACAAKAGIDKLIQVLAIEWASDGIRCNAIAPGPVDDTEGMRRLSPTPEIKKALTDLMPIGRYLTKEEVSSLAVYLASPAGAAITGAIIVIDGGQSLHGSGAFLQALMSMEM